MPKNVCRLCHGTFNENDFETIEETKREVIRALGLSLDFHVTAEPVVCIRCWNSLDEMFKFKSKCIYINDYLSPYMENNPLYDLSLIHPRAMEDNLKTCRLCFTASVELASLVKGERRLFQELFSEIELSNRPICSSCQQSLKKYFEFAFICKRNEEENLPYYIGLIKAIIEKAKKSLEKEKRYKCDKCDYETNHKAYFHKVHMKLHLDRSSLYECEKCDYSTNTRPKLNLHLNKAHKVPLKKYKCDKCDYSTDNPTYLKKTHMLSHQSTYDSYQCPKCPLKTKYRCSLNKHISTKHSDQSLYCFHCPFQTIHKISMVRHVKLHQKSVEPFECDKCNFITNTRYEITMHLKEHGSDSCFECDKCNYKSKWPIGEHKCLGRKKRVYNCVICGGKYTSSYSYKMHRIKEHNLGKVRYHECPHCEYRTLYRKHILKHHKLHTNPDKNIYKCDKCSLQTYSSYHLNKHLVQDHQFDGEFNPEYYLHVKHFSMKSFKCSKCKFSCVREKTLRAHEEAHDTFPFICDQCPYRTDTAKKLDSHKVHHRQKKFKCTHCDYMAKTMSVVRAHAMKHDKRTEKVRCPHCPFESLWKVSLRNHMNIHLKQMYKCSYCDFETVHRKSLTSHEQNVHRKHGQTDYKCDSCDFVTKRKDSMVQHQLVHKDPSEIKMYKCEDCSFETKYKRSLRNHIRDRHMEEDETKPKIKRQVSDSEDETFKCAMCPFETSKKIYLNRHVVTHHCEKNFKCDSCTFITKRKPCLTAHMKTHKVYSEEEMAKCPHCNFMTKYPRSLKNHISNKHESWEVVEEETHLKIVSLNA